MALSGTLSFRNLRIDNAAEHVLRSIAYAAFLALLYLE